MWAEPVLLGTAGLRESGLQTMARPAISNSYLPEPVSLGG